MIYFLLGVIVGGAVTLLFVVFAANRISKTMNHDEADWWKRGKDPHEYDS